MEFYVGQVFTGKYPPAAAIWVNNQNSNPDTTETYSIVQVENGYKIDSTPIVLPTVSELASDKKHEAMSAFDAASVSLVEYYSDKEVATFYKQEKEAVAWYEGVQSGKEYTNEQLLQLFPFLYSLSVARSGGIPFDILATKVLEKVAMIAVPNGTILGAKQTVEDMVDGIVSADGTKDQINSISVLDVFNEKVQPLGFMFSEDYKIIPIVE